MGTCFKWEDLILLGGYISQVPLQLDGAMCRVLTMEMPVGVKGAGGAVSRKQLGQLHKMKDVLNVPYSPVTL